ncbi:MAG: hypothetical protein OXD54_03705 [Candidatus Poribacteria bacterium]|nr:hypothetical protein [Candidatus Poribacteria bacterium]
MKQYSILITLAGSILVVCCFALPWVTFTSGGYKKSWETDVKKEKLSSGAIARFSRPVTEQGRIRNDVPVTHHNYLGFKIAAGWNIITIVLIASIVSAGCSIYMLTQHNPRKSKLFVLISSGIGIGCLLLTFLLVTVVGENGLRSIGNTTYTANGNIQIGGIATVICFIITLIGAWNIPKTDAAIDDNE